MHYSQSPGSAHDCAGTSCPDGGAIVSPPTDNDAALLMFEVQFDGLVSELLSAQKLNVESDSSSLHQRSLVRGRLLAGLEAQSDHDAQTQQIESILARLYPIEQAIVQTPARTIAGLGVKARHAAYVMSHYWESPIDRIDWDARAVRSLIEAVCDFAQTPLPFQNLR